MKTDDSEKGSQQEVIKSQIYEQIGKIIDYVESDSSLGDSSDTEASETESTGMTDQLAALMMGLEIQKAIDSEEIQKQSAQIIEEAPHKMKNQGPRDVSIQTSRGKKVTVKLNYYSRSCLKGKRKKNRAGLYPAFLLLGIYDRITPGLASEIASFSVLCSSFEEASLVLKGRGVEMDAKKVRDITYRFAKRAEAIRDGKGLEIKETVSGRTVVVSTDGGRIRIRTKKRGPKTPKGRTRYTTKWREPKLLIIYTVDEDGKIDKSFTPFMDGTMKGPKAVFGLMKFYLERLGICMADKILFVADGARWIWSRVPALFEALGIPKGQYYELVDFYHAVEHLGKIAKLRKGWKKAERKRWIKKQRALLLKGDIEGVIQNIKTLCKGRRSKKLIREKEYFSRNQHRMRYKEIKESGLPIGSGSIESAIRRVVNLRLKGPAIHWEKKAAERMLLLRSFFKAGRWEMLKNAAFSRVLEEKV